MIMMPYGCPWVSPQVTVHADFWHPTGPGGDGLAARRRKRRSSTTGPVKGQGGGEEGAGAPGLGKGGIPPEHQHRPKASSAGGFARNTDSVDWAKELPLAWHPVMNTSRRVLGFTIAQCDAHLAYSAPDIAVSCAGQRRVSVGAYRGSEGGFNWSSQDLDLERMAIWVQGNVNTRWLVGCAGHVAAEDGRRLDGARPGGVRAGVARRRVRGLGGCRPAGRRPSEIRDGPCRLAGCRRSARPRMRGGTCRSASARRRVGVFARCGWGCRGLFARWVVAVADLAGAAPQRFDSQSLGGGGGAWCMPGDERAVAMPDGVPRPPRRMAKLRGEDAANKELAPRAGPACRSDHRTVGELVPGRRARLHLDMVASVPRSLDSMVQQS